MIRVCFVCLGNICRSPTAEAIMKDLVARALLGEHIAVESAGTGDWHVGQQPDPRSTAAAARRGLALAGRARQFEPSDFEDFDYVLAMDASNFANLSRMAKSAEARSKLRMLRSFDPASPPGASVPDPYDTADGFDEVIDLCTVACERLLAHVRETHELP